MELHAILTFLVAIVVLNSVPGPGMMFLLAHGIVGGRRTGVTAALGLATGTVTSSLRERDAKVVIIAAQQPLRHFRR